MKAVLADLALESEAATAGAMRLARANEAAHAGDGDAEMFRRLAAPVLKYWTCKRAPQHLAEALECQGGFGYIEESRLARAYREAPLMSIWEGSGNVQALDVLRAWRRSPGSRDALIGEIDLASGADSRLDEAISGLRSELAGEPVGEAAARGLCGRLARALQASLLVRHSSARVGCLLRSAPWRWRRWRRSATLPAGVDLDAILERARLHGSADAGRRSGATGARSSPTRADRRGSRQESARHLEDLIRQAAEEHEPDAIWLPEAMTSPNAYDRRMRKVARPLIGEPLALLRKMAREYGCLVGGGFIAVRGKDTRGTYALCRARRRQTSARQGSAQLLGEQLLLARHRRRRDGHVARRHRLRERLRVGAYPHGPPDEGPGQAAGGRHALPVLSDLAASRSSGSGTATIRLCCSTRGRPRRGWPGSWASRPCTRRT